MKRVVMHTSMSALLLSMLMATSASAAFKFGVMSDTQWPTSPDGKNPNTSAINVIRHLNQQFIAKDVKFVIQVGDLVDSAGTNNVNLDVRATFAQDLYNAGIGFYPLRGNHESGASAAVRFQQLFPQTQTGVNNQTPILVSTTIYGPQINTNSTFTVGSNFATQPTMEGLTYSFDYDNARFVLIDQFTKPSGTSHSTLNQTDVDWIGGRFADPSRPAHGFSFAHKGLITENHYDNLFGSNPDASTTVTNLTNSFMSYLAGNGVRYHMGGHDHMHNRAVVASPDGQFRMQNIIAASNSYKFYIPAALGSWSSRETMLSQELFSIGYYIFTVDGPKVTAEYYASPNGCGGDCDLTNDIIPYTFTKRESFGYSLNGKEVLVPQGGSYELTDDTAKAVANGEGGYLGTTARVLNGTNGSTAVDYRGRALTKGVNTGWAARTAATASDIFTLWGMADLSAAASDPFVLSLSYDPTDISAETLYSGTFGLAVKDEHRGWINAVAKNFGGTATFIVGPWSEGYGLGTYGIDPVTNTAWAVINHNSDFAVAAMAPANTPPTVTIAEPAANATFDAPAAITITADAHDDEAVAMVEFYHGATKIGEATAEPFTMTWSGLLSGSYDISAVATDNEGMSSPSTPVTVTVANLDNEFPSVALTAPAAGASMFVGGAATLAATAADTDGTIAKVEFFANGGKLGEDMTAPYSFSWTADVVGTYTLTARATDNDGGVTTSSPVEISVVTVPSGGTVDYQQDFNAMGTTGTTPPAGWSVKNANSGTSNSTWSTSIPANGSNSVATMVNASGNLTATTTPTSTNNNGYNAAAAGVTTDRMIATSPTSVAGGAIQLQLANTSGGYIDRLMIGYDIYRINAPSSVNELPGYWLFYSLDNGASWTNVATLNPSVSGPAGVVVPNTAGKTTVAPAPLALAGKWNPSAQILFRWVDDNGVPTSPDQMYGLDNVSVKSATALPMSVSTSGLVYSRATRVYTGTMTLTNAGSSSISGQIYVSLADLTPGVALVNATGSDNLSPFIAKPLSQALNPGESIAIPLSFSNPANAKITFAPVMFQ